MDLNTTISQVAASDPRVGLALQKQATESAVLAALTNVQAGDSQLLESILGTGQAPNLPTSTQPTSTGTQPTSSEPGVGENVDTLA